MSPIAGSKSAYLRNILLDHALSAASWTPPATLYIALSTAAFAASATGSAMTEVASTGAYARVAVTANTTNFPAASAGAKSNGTVITFPAATGSWGTVLSYYVCDASSAGNILYGADLTASRTIASGDTASFAAGAMSFTET